MKPYRYIIFWNVSQTTLYEHLEKLDTNVCTPERLDYWREYYGVDNETTDAEVFKKGYISGWQWYAVPVYRKGE